MWNGPLFGGGYGAPEDGEMSLIFYQMLAVLSAIYIC
jgi:hypothetical protein